MKKSIKTLLSVLVLTFAVTVLVPTVSIVNAEAKTTKVTTSHYMKKAKAVKLGKNQITSVEYDKKMDKPKKGSVPEGYIKFTATKKGKYTFTFENPVEKYDSESTAKVHIYAGKGMSKKNQSKPDKELEMKTKGGRTDSLELCSQFYYNYKTPSSISCYTALPSRSTTLSLKAGETVYFKLQNIDIVVLDLTIKKK